MPDRIDSYPFKVPRLKVIERGHTLSADLAAQRVFALYSPIKSVFLPRHAALVLASGHPNDGNV